MTFSPRPLSKLVALAPLALTIALVGLVSSGCEDKHIGRVCALDVADAGTGTTGTTATINSSAVECPTRICVKPAADKNTNTAALCSAGCSSDDDCSDGETTSDQASPQCKTGFTCMVASTVGKFCCERLCVCRDFIDTSRTGYNATPKVCLPGATTCANVH